MTLDVVSPASIAAFVRDLQSRTDHVDLLLHNGGWPERAGQWSGG